MAGQLRDMCERLRLEASRREAILASMVEGVLAVDHELCVTFCNESFGHAVRALPGARAAARAGIGPRPGPAEHAHARAGQRRASAERLELTAAEGRTFEVQAAPLEFRSGRGAIAILHDVSDLERLERVRRDFVANVSHELRTPLAAIQGYAETLLDGGLEDQEHNRRFSKLSSRTRCD